MARKRLGEMLVEQGLLDVVGLRRALIEQRRWGGQLGTTLIDLGLVTEKALVATLSSQLHIPAVDLAGFDIPGEVIALVPKEIAERAQVVPFRLEGKFLDVAMSNPMNLGITDELRIRTQLNVRPHLVGPKTLERVLIAHYGVGDMSHVGPAAIRKHLVIGGTLEDGEIDVDLDDVSEDQTEVRPVDAQQTDRSAEFVVLQRRVSNLEALVARDEDVIRKLLALLVDKGVASREEILERIH